MKKLKALFHDLQNADLCDAEQLAAWIDSGKIQSQKKGSETDSVFFKIIYDANIRVMQFDRDLGILLLWMHLWLAENDPERDVDFDFEGEILEDGSTNLLISVNFEELPEFVKDANGLWESGLMDHDIADALNEN